MRDEEIKTHDELIDLGAASAVTLGIPELFAVESDEDPDQRD
jgi:hypothetical protein